MIFQTQLSRRIVIGYEKLSAHYLGVVKSEIILRYL